MYGNYIDEVIQIRDHTPATKPEDDWAHQDDLFSVYVVTDAAGAVTQRYLYGDYGTRITTDAAGLAGFEPALEVDHGFTGRLHDEISGLIEYRHRWMSPGMGRFMQRDPLWYVDGMNVYSLAIDNPLTRVDPLGLRSWNSDCRYTGDYRIDVSRATLFLGPPPSNPIDVLSNGPSTSVTITTVTCECLYVCEDYDRGFVKCGYKALTPWGPVVPNYKWAIYRDPSDDTAEWKKEFSQRVLPPSSYLALSLNLQDWAGVALGVPSYASKAKDAINSNYIISYANMLEDLEIKYQKKIAQYSLKCEEACVVKKRSP